LVRELPAPRQAQASLPLDPVSASPAVASFEQAVSPLETPPSAAKLPLSFSTPEVITSAEAVRGALAWLRTQRRIAIHGEIAGAGGQRGELVGLALAARGEGARSFYLPIAHQGLGGRYSSEASTELAALL